MEERGLRKERVGIVVSDKMDKTITVAVVNKYKHPLYKKTVSKTKKNKEKPSQLPKKDQGVKGNKINTDKMEYHLTEKHHDYQVTPCDETEHADEKQQCRKHKEKFNWYHTILLLSRYYNSTDDARKQKHRDELERQHILIFLRTHKRLAYNVHRNFCVRHLH